MIQSVLRVQICKFCQSKITPEMIFGSTIICGSCGQVETKAAKHSLLAKTAFALATISTLAGFAFYMKDEVRQVINPNSVYATMNEAQLSAANLKCLYKNDLPCEVETLRHLAELDPSSISYAANFAFKLTQSRKYQEADPIYKDILAKGEGTYDLMYYYGQNLDGLKQTTEAVKWYEKSLAIASNNISTARALATDYIQQKNPMAALSLLRSFVMKYPSAEGIVAGNISSILELVGETPDPKGSKITISSIDGSHFSIPVTVGDSTSKSFLVDTGATVVTLPTVDAKSLFPELMSHSELGRARLADGRMIEMHLVKVPELRVGPWKVQNVEVSYCDSCERLAGMSLLKKFKMETGIKGKFSSLTLSHDAESK